MNTTSMPEARSPAELIAYLTESSKVDWPAISGHDLIEVLALITALQASQHEEDEQLADIVRQRRGGKVVQVEPEELDSDPSLPNVLLLNKAEFRKVECAHTGMSYGDEKRGGASDYARGFGDCLAAVKRAAIDAAPAASTNEKIRS